MYEVELKVRATHDGVTDRLEALGADPLGTARQEDTYYDPPHRDFAESDEALRVRRETRGDGDQQAFLTYKGSLVDDVSKTRPEAETAVADESAIAAILENLAFEPAAIVRKHRERYSLDGFTVTLDTVDGLGEFVEIEAETTVETEADIESARQSATAVLERLGLDDRESIRTSYLEMILGDGGDDPE